MKRANRHFFAKGLLDAAVIFLTLSFLMWAGCSGDQIPGPELEEGQVFEQVDPRVAHVLDVQERHTDDLMSRTGVVGTATRIDENGKPVVVVYMQSQMAAKAAQVPERIEDVPVVVEVTGMFVAYSDPTTRQRPAPVGFSVGHPDITAGTIGARVKDAGGNVYVLSNNHVLANGNDANIGDSALQPGPYDGGTDPEDKIGELFAFEPILFDGSDNTIDAAIALSSTADLGYATPDDAYGAPSSTTKSAEVEQRVQKYGRTTGHTHGEVSEINVTVDVCYETRGPFMCAKAARFVDQIAITPGTFSAGGDSGSLIVDANKNPVGLLFAGSDTRTLANPIDIVLDHFNVTIDDGSEDGGDANNPPTASFTYSCTNLSCEFDGSGSSDSDGSITSYDWNFGDGNAGSGSTVSHTYSSDGTYTVTLTVIDDDGATGNASENVSVSSPPSGDFSLTATGYKERGRHTIDLTWSGATSNDVDIYRDGSLLTTTENDGAYTDATNNRGGGSYTYQVCEAGTSTCSNEATVTF